MIIEEGIWLRCGVKWFENGINIFFIFSIQNFLHLFDFKEGGLGLMRMWFFIIYDEKRN